MTRLELGITDLLDERFNIELEEYWKLNEKDKNYLTSVVVSSFIKKLYNEPHLIEFYLSMMDDRRMEAENSNDFERAEIISRIQKKTKELFNKH